MPRYKLTIAYDGTDFSGWQKQLAADRHEGRDDDGSPPREDQPRDYDAVRTVQWTVQKAVMEIVREPVELVGASRTDAGVHARGQVAAFTCSDGAAPSAADPSISTPDEPPRSGDEEGHNASGVHGNPGEAHAGTRAQGGWPVARGLDRLVRAINGRLPGDMIVLAAQAVAPGFDPIRDAAAKGYSYTLHVSRARPLWDRRYVHHVWEELSLERMREAAALFVGEHDFAAFAAAGHGRKSTVRTIFDCRVMEEAVRETPGSTPAASGLASRDSGSLGKEPARWSIDPARRFRIEVSGNGFLWNMVRIIAGTLVEVGRGKIAPEKIPAIIAGANRRHAGPTLPPTGLCLEWIRYG